MICFTTDIGGFIWVFHVPVTYICSPVLIVFDTDSQCYANFYTGFVHVPKYGQIWFSKFAFYAELTLNECQKLDPFPWLGKIYAVTWLKTIDYLFISGSKVY